MASPNSSDAAGLKLLRIQDLRSIMDTLVDVQSDWKSIGVALGLPLFDLDSIQNSSSTPLSDTLELWLQSERHTTVEHLASVLQDVGQAIIAQKVTEKFTCHNDGKFYTVIV